MKPSCAICVLLCTLAIGLVSCENKTDIKPNNENILNKGNVAQVSVSQQKDEVTDKPSTTTAVPASGNSTTVQPITTTKPDTTTASTTTSQPHTTTVTTPATTVPTTTVPPHTTNATTTTPSTTTQLTTTPTGKPTTTPTPAPSPNTTTVSPNVTTTAVPPTPSPGRHFDGLSFLGGIILTVCLMAIGVFLWKFSRTCNEANYRTL